MRFTSLFRSLVVYLALFVCFANAQTVAKAHVIYDGEGLFYADNEENLKFLPLDKKRDGTYVIDFNAERLKPEAIEARRLRFGLGCTEKTKNCATYLYSSEESLPTLKSLFPDYDSKATSQPLYEVWLKVDATGVTVLPTIPPEYVVPDSVERVFRFLPPWNNTSAIMFIDGEQHKMYPITKNYCGWFEATVKFVPKDVYASFKQTIGDTYIGKDGVEKQPVSIENELGLDSVIALSDTIWISAKYGYPEASATFPGELGDCPVKILPVMMFDWLHGDGSDEENAKAQAGTTSQDFGTGGCAQLTKGMVEEDLGVNGVPVRANPFPENCKITEHLNNWFIPEVITTGANGKKYTNATCRNLELTMDSAGFWLGQKNKESPEKGLFFLDDFKYLEPAADMVPNPYFDWVNGGDYYGRHNYGFTMKIQAQFEYVKGQKFSFLGDDDVWVFINNKLVVDIGGQHHSADGSVNLDDLGLVEGETYPFHIFYAERHRDESNFKMRTSIDLRTDASMLLKDIYNDPKLIGKDVFQIVRERELACDFNSSPETEKLEFGPANFVLFGKGVSKGGVALKTLDSAYYGGITISNNYTRVTIDIESLGRAMLLPPGNYFIRVTLQSNPDEYKDIPFTIDPYKLPNLAYAQNVKDSNYFTLGFNTEDTLLFTQYWKPFGDEISRNISSDTLPINLNKFEKMWAGRSYPVYIMYAEEWAAMYNGIAVSISASTPALVACDSMGNVINEVLLQQGRAQFYVKALDQVVDGTLIISSAGAENGKVLWTNINIEVPPVPPIDSAFIYDRNGDGRGDSIWVSFKKPLGGQSVLDSLKFVFGNEFNTPYKARYNDGESFATVVAEGNGFGTSIFTGGATSPYNGKVTVFYTYTDDDGKVSYFPVEGPLQDRVGPVIVAAEVEYMSDGNTLLKLSFSEGLNDENANIGLFNFHCWRDFVQKTDVKTPGDIGTTPANQWSLVFTKGSELEVVPAVGDSVRFTPPSVGGNANDLLGTIAHEFNPWVRITGEQRVTVTSPTVVTLNPNSPNFETAKEIIKSDSATVPKLVISEQTLNAEQVSNIFGTQGHYLGDLDMAQLVENEIAEIVTAIQGTPSYTNVKDSLAPAVTIEEIIAAVSSGKMSIDDAQDLYGISDVIVDAYNNGLLTKENLPYYSRGTEADIKNIVSAVADQTVLTYKTFYYTSLGHFVNNESGKITCNDDIFKVDGGKNCLDSDGKLFLAWNMRSSNGRLAATGVYIARLEIKIRVNNKIITDRTQDFLWGVRRGQVNAIDLGL